MNPIRRIRRISAVLAGLAAGLVAFATPAFAMPVPASGSGSAPAPRVPAREVTHTLVLGGMPGWQIALITAGAALLAVVLAIIAYQIRAAHRRVTSPAA